MRVGAAVGEGDELGEGVGALGAAEEGGGAVLGCGDWGSGEVRPAKGGGVPEEGHAGCMFVCLEGRCGAVVDWWLSYLFERLWGDGVLKSPLPQIF